METRKSTYLKPVGTLQLIAIIAVVIGHFAVKEPAFMNSLWVSFCFVYSGFFTAKRHRFGPDYGIKEHAHFMLDKLAKLYPLHLLALAFVFFSAWVVWGDRSINLKVLFCQLTMISPWVPDRYYYFGINPVAWFLCDLFFLYLMAPLLVKALRRCRLSWQLIGILALLVLEFIGGYSPDDGTGPSATVIYLLYEFPPIRLLDFSTGIILYNITQGSWWKHLQRHVTAKRATIIEVAGILLFLILYMVEKTFLSGYCYRAFCVVAPSVVVLLATFLLTSGSNGLISKALGCSFLGSLNAIGAEIYLLQLGVYYLMKPTFKALDLHLYQPQQFVLFFSVLLLISWLTHRYYVTPIGRWLGAWHEHFIKR